MEIGIANLREASRSMTGRTRGSSFLSNAAAPGRVDSPPTSMIPAPCSTISYACATARSTST
jgi:hypothetical protein